MVKKVVTSEQLIALQFKINQIKEFWKAEKKPFEGILISVHYNKIVAKGNRISGLFKWNEQQIKLSEILGNIKYKPLFGDKRAKTHWMVFMK